MSCNLHLTVLTSISRFKLGLENNISPTQYSYATCALKYTVATLSSGSRLSRALIPMLGCRKELTCTGVQQHLLLSTSLFFRCLCMYVICALPTMPPVHSKGDKCLIHCRGMPDMRILLICSELHAHQFHPFALTQQFTKIPFPGITLLYTSHTNWKHEKQLASTGAWTF